MGRPSKKGAAANEQKTWTKRIFELIAEYNILTGTSIKDVFSLLGIGYSAHGQLKSGSRSFTVEQVISASKLFSVSSDWILGLTDERSTVNAPISSELEKLIEKKVSEQIVKHQKNV